MRDLSYTIGMARKRVLVVDDSKSARVILSRMLEKYDIEVDMAEAAERAIEYLKSNRPDAIFMDHQMPGMDGLQALQTIKSNPKTAMIPIMMYTSQEGELYVGQARALGAMGVLPKQVRPVDVSKVLYELHLLPDRRDMNDPALAPVEIIAGSAVEVMPVAKAVPPSASIDWGRRVESAVKDQAVDLRRFIVASLDSFASRIVSDVRHDRTPPAEPLPAPPPLKTPSQLPWVLSLASVGIVAVVFAVSWLKTRSELDGVRAQLSGLASANSELQRTRADLSATVKDLTAAVAATNSGVVGSAFDGANGAALFASRVEPVPYGEIPFDRGRLDALREFLARLESQGFRGVVRITNLAGMFCLSGNAADGFAPAAANLPMSKCDLIGNPFEESLSSQQRESLAFANLIAGVRQRASGAIAIDLESGGTSRNSMPYPARTEGLTAGEWNRAAAANNRVEFAAESSQPAP
jgi:CheY-like chemotaxis protein